VAAVAGHAGCGPWLLRGEAGDDRAQSAALQQRCGALRDRPNAAASPPSQAWRDLPSLLTA
jgi:hypothetical protein